MIQLNPNEKILIVLHRHWLVLFGKLVVCVFLALVPFLALGILAASNIQVVLSGNIILFAFSVYMMIIALIMFLFWMDYYFDIWIITTERIIDIEQRGLFNREVSEFMLMHVEDVTIEIPGILATLMKFGNIMIQTAGENSFKISQVPRVYEAKNIILQYSMAHNNHTQHGRTQQMETN